MFNKIAEPVQHAAYLLFCARNLQGAKQQGALFLKDESSENKCVQCAQEERRAYLHVSVVDSMQGCKAPMRAMRMRMHAEEVDAFKIIISQFSLLQYINLFCY